MNDRDNLLGLPSWPVPLSSLRHAIWPSPQELDDCIRALEAMLQAERGEAE